MTYPRYPKYRESGVEWLGDVPEGWGVKKVGFCCDFYTGWTPPTGDESSYDGDLPWANISDIGPKFLTETAKRISMSAVRKHKIRIAPNGSLLFSFKLSVGQVSIAAVPMYTNEAIAIFQSSANILSRWAYYTFPICIPKNASENIYGAKMLNQYLIKSAKIVLPPIEEQHAIAAFLDTETARIDALIAEYETLIELLKEKRQALISQAVTKGLNPDVPMKDSGVEWLGEVPEGWEVKRLRFIAELNPSKSECSGIEGDSQVSFLPMEAVGDDGSLNLEHVRPICEVNSGYTYFREGDVTIAKITPCFENGKGAVMRGLQGGIGFGTTELIVIRPIPQATVGEYIHLLFICAYFRKFGESWMYGAGGQKRVPDDFVRNFKVGIPPVAEQHAIATLLDAETSRMDGFVQEAENGINLLRERRTTLISDAVTGKIDVRNVQRNPAGSIS